MNGRAYARNYDVHQWKRAVPLQSYDFICKTCNTVAHLSMIFERRLSLVTSFMSRIIV